MDVKKNIVLFLAVMLQLTRIKGDKESLLLKDILNSDVYEKRLRPHSGGDALVVNSTMYVVSLGPVSEVDMTFRVGLYFRQYWRDDRLKFSLEYYKGNHTFTNDVGLTEDEMFTEKEKLVLSQDLLSSLWLPDSFFQTETESYVHEVTKRNVFFRLHGNGNILMSMRVTVTSRCPMDLAYFPMDVQACELRIASWGYTSDDITYQWKYDPKTFPIVLAQDITLSNFRVINFTCRSWDRSLSTGNWSTLGAKFVFGRNTLYFIIQMYIPSTLIVMVSWVSFWVGRSSVPARAALGITTVLTLLTLISSTNANMPKISYMKAIDVYFASCFLFVFASLIEFAAVCYLDKPQSPPKIKKSSMKHRDFMMGGPPVPASWHPSNSGGMGGAGGAGVHLHQATPSNRSRALDGSYSNFPGRGSTPYTKLKQALSNRLFNQSEKKRFNVGAIDRFSRYFFPITFFTMMVIYWSVYLHKSYESKAKMNVEG
ncbi:gamma-aminobutyric acid receptor subunit beta-like isoform X3 [Convolutriloba macropyga]|uniref:gamma-aminobutyric acid receptor subunit beta-like isoform X3 n=1 Tax=Convolutriloba macropyga TaxID=536237 RepID=UPI003F5250EF